MEHKLQADDGVFHGHWGALVALENDIGSVYNFSLLVVYNTEVKHRYHGTEAVHQSIHVHVWMSRVQLLGNHFLKTCEVGRSCVLSGSVSKSDSDNVSCSGDDLVGLSIERLVPLDELMKLVENGKLLHYK